MSYSHEQYLKLIEETKEKYQNPPAGSFSIKTFADDADIPETTANGILKRLLAEGKIEKLGLFKAEPKGSATYYMFVESE